MHRVVYESKEKKEKRGPELGRIPAESQTGITEERPVRDTECIILTDRFFSHVFLNRATMRLGKVC